MLGRLTHETSQMWERKRTAAGHIATHTTYDKNCGGWGGANAIANKNVEGTLVQAERAVKTIKATAVKTKQDKLSAQRLTTLHKDFWECIAHPPHHTFSNLGVEKT